MVCRRSARSLSLKRERVKQEASVNAAPNPRMVCAVFAGSTVTSAGAAFFAIFVQTISAPAASRFPLLSVTSVRAGLFGGCAWSAAALAFTGSPNAEAVAAPIPSPAYFKISRRDVMLGSRLSLNYSRGLQQRRFAAWDSILQNSFILGTPRTPDKSCQLNRSMQHHLVS